MGSGEQGSGEGDSGEREVGRAARRKERSVSNPHNHYAIQELAGEGPDLLELVRVVRIEVLYRKPLAEI